VSGTLLIAPAWLGLSGLWILDAKGKRKPVDAEDIGLSEDLADRLEIWMDAFDAIYEEDNEARSRFPDAVEQMAWEAEGAAIAVAIAAELGPDWTVSTDLTGWQEMTKP
jgi:L-ribulose-5-phosphate 3-epimerase UlaE